MIRIVLSLMLLLQLLVPARAQLWLLTAMLPMPTRTEPVPPEGKATVCPCTGAPVCKCGSCCSEPSEPEPGSPAAVQKTEGEKKSADETSPKRPKGKGAELRCRGTSPESLNPSVDYFSHAHHSGFVTIATPRIDLLAASADSCSSVTMPVDSPPPREVA